MNSTFKQIYESSWQRQSIQDENDLNFSQELERAKTEEDVKQLVDKHDTSLVPDIKKSQLKMIDIPGLYFKVENFTESWDAADYYENTERGKHSVPESWQIPWFFYITGNGPKDGSITVYWYNKEWRDAILVKDPNNQQQINRFNQANKLNNKDLQEWAEDFELGEGKRIYIKGSFSKEAKKRKYIAYNKVESGVGIEGALAALESEILRSKKLFGYDKKQTAKMYMSKEISKEDYKNITGLTFGGKTIGLHLCDAAGYIDNSGW
jgi:hypothetical protein